ncbi:Protein ABHD15 [Holothuria leucospilota]|uniref:Protein ABHD15 n=1 Tax=Holothuria leucospilota TaxID=206669 RepID=A0A9Q1CDB1_HOLLE|nr:Protein ABHD15 [Holothuria leucospilota]
MRSKTLTLSKRPPLSTRENDGRSLEMSMTENRNTWKRRCQTFSFLLTLLVRLSLNFVKNLASLFQDLKRIWNSRWEKPQLHYKRSKMQESIIKNCKTLTSELENWFLPGWIQTLSNLVSHHWYEEAVYHRRLLQVNDGGLVGMDWYLKMSPKRGPILLVLPGKSHLALSEDIICAQAYEKGFRPVVFRNRGSSGITLTSVSKFQAMGYTSDLREVVRYLRRMDSKANIVAIGIGSGAGLLLSYLGDYGSSCHLDAAVCLSPWYSLEKQVGSSHQTFSQWVLLQSLKIELARHSGVLKSKIDLDKAFGTSSLIDYIKHVVWPINHCETEHDFYEKNEPLRDIDEMAIPLLCINSLDDPVVNSEHIPFDLFETLPNVMLAATRRGGHGAFLKGWNAENWGVKLAVDYCETILNIVAGSNLSGLGSFTE